VAYGDVIFQSGNVGIGTTSPAGKLHILKDSVLNDGFTESESALLIKSLSTDSQSLRIGTDNTAKIGVIQSVESGVGVKSLILNPDGGNVGIGTTAPNAKLEVTGDVIIDLSD